MGTYDWDSYPPFCSANDIRYGSNIEVSHVLLKTIHCACVKAEGLQEGDRVLVSHRLRAGQDRAGPDDLPGDEQDDMAVRSVGRLGPQRAAEMRP